MGYMIYMIQLFQASQVTKLIRLITGWRACQNFFERAGSLPHHKLWSLIRRPFAFQLWVDTLAFLWTLLRRWKAWTVIASHWYQVRCRQPARLLLGQPSTVSVWYIQFLSPRVARVGELLHNLRWTAGGIRCLIFHEPQERLQASKIYRTWHALKVEHCWSEFGPWRCLQHWTTSEASVSNTFHEKAFGKLTKWQKKMWLNDQWLVSFLAFWDIGVKWLSGRLQWFQNGMSVHVVFLLKDASKQFDGSANIDHWENMIAKMEF